MRQFFILIYTIAAASLGLAQTPSPTPPVLREEVTVTTNRIETRIAETPASVVALSSGQIRSAAAPTIDEVLRQSVGFSIFRRTGSRTANPTTQGVSLRGVGSSGASRTSVMLDGIPLNDPFGGWIQWNRVVPIGVDVIEVRRGGASSLYGASGLSGAINIKPRATGEEKVFSADLFAGSQRTVSGSVFTGFDLSKWQVALTVGSFQTRGYRPVDEDARGPIDSFSGVRSFSSTATVSRKFDGIGTLFFRPSYFGEVRSNGTGLQTNRTHFREAAAGGESSYDHLRNLRITWRGYSSAQVYDQVFSAVNASRTAESITRLQRVPARSIGFNAQASMVLGDHVVLAGGELRGIRGASDELAYAAGSPSAFFGAGGREFTTGVYFQDFARIGDRVIVSGVVRYDRWEHYRAVSSTRPIAAGSSTNVPFPDRVESAFSPHFAVLYRLNGRVSLFTAASRSFRSPTLNELYRGFRVGNIQTLPNENLRAERANNLEAGIRYSQGEASFRSNVFWTSINGPVSNVTLTISPSLITRQRQNAGRTATKGIEAEGDVRFGRIGISVGYLFVRSTVSSFPANPDLVRRRVPQVPQHQVTFQLRYSAETYSLALQARASSEQFDDDLNLFRLEPFGQFDVFASRRLNGKVELYAAVENVLDSQYSTGKTPIRTVGSPINLRIGLRYR